MRFTIVPILYLVLAVGVAADDFNHTASDMECGTTADANLADCEVLLNNPIVFEEKADLWYKWEYPGWRLACNGACCLYVRVPEEVGSLVIKFEAYRLDARELLGCASREEGRRKGLVNGVATFSKGGNDGRDEHVLCLANINLKDSMKRCFNGLPHGY